MTGEQQIITLIKANKHDGFQRLFNLYYRPMCVFGAKYISSIDIVEDIVQDIFIKIWKHDDYDWLKHIRSYLFTAVKNSCISYLKKNKPISLDNLDYSWEKDLFIDIDDDELIKEKIQIVKKAISELPPGCRRVFDNVVVSGLKYTEAAEELGISVNTVKSQLKKAYRLIGDNLHLVTLFLLAGE